VSQDAPAVLTKNWIKSIDACHRYHDDNMMDESTETNMKTDNNTSSSAYAQNIKIYKQNNTITARN